MKIKDYILTALVLLTSCFFVACDDDDDNSSQAKAVLASAKSLTFDGLNAEPQMITVYSDAQWTAEVPEWISISPATGSGTTEVTISVVDNLRGGTLDNPRKAELVFKGASIASRSSVLVQQKGDNYRDCPQYTVDKVYELANETYMDIPEALVVTKLADGCMVADNACSNYVYVATSEVVVPGDKISLKAQKLTDSQKMAYVNAEEVTVISQNNAINHGDATDITATLDTYKSDKRDYVSAEGILVGKTITVEGAAYTITVADVSSSINLEEVDGHTVKVFGYFAGVAAPYVRLYIDAVEDHGAARITYWTEDFEWLEPFAVAKDAGRTVETDNPDATAPQIKTPVVDGVTALAYAENLGYEFHRVNTKNDPGGECIYIQRNYLKMGKTSYHAGLTLPSINTIPADVDGLTLEFDWCPMRQGSKTDYKIDPVNLIVIVKNGEAETTFSIPTHGWANGHKLEWIKATVDLSSVKVDKDTKITIRQTEWEDANTANRWFIDNISFYSAL